MKKKVGSGISIILAIILFLAQQYANANKLITPENSNLLLWPIGFLIVAALALLVWGFGVKVKWIFIWLTALTGKIRQNRAVTLEIRSTTVPTQHAAKYPIEIKLMLKLHKPPMQLAELKLCLMRKNGDFMYDPVSPDLSSNAIRLLDKDNYIIARYEVPFGNWRQAFLPNDQGKYQCHYQIRSLIGGEQYYSEENVFKDASDPLGRGA